MKPNGAAIETGAFPALSDEAVAAEIDKLSKLSEIAYEREREPAAKRLGMRASILDKLVRAGRDAGEGETSGQGRAIDLPEPTPWHQPVDGAALLADIAAEVKRHVILDAGAAETVGLWSLHAHAIEAFGISPRLAITSPRPQCGKTTLLDVLHHLVPRPLQMANISAAAVFRTVELTRPTLLCDEADTWLQGNDELRGILNSGHRRGGSVIRVVGDALEPRQFSTWGACAIALIGKLPATLADRSISVMLQRKRPDEAVETFRFDRTEALDELASKAARWVKDSMARLGAIDPAMPPCLSNRAADNWRPLLAIADAAGGDWPRRARDIAEAMVDADQSKRAGLLSDIRDIFAAKRVEHMASAALVDSLVAIEGSDWAEYKGRALTKHTLARLLARDGISPGTIRTGSGPKDTIKGYKLSQFADAFARYLPEPPIQTVTPSQAAEIRHFSAIEHPSQQKPCDGSQNPEKPQKSAGCDVVTDQKEGIPEIIDEEGGEEGENREWQGESSL